ncbi:hypothetical protein [Psychromonas sp. Urea-02u-13]|uniref:hypothetical protein n=1 Tax=Psychromonas sp. Urea-02u-13 TaxID=2058326 RepID=UPI000C33BCCA|nr:hypothetical protein [Psychromonas sp. Urea-02u-13]PKG37876.1 hypothetical protein CXF74_16450 [Psychromonas sp. Urea-02u-13]
MIFTKNKASALQTLKQRWEMQNYESLDELLTAKKIQKKQNIIEYGVANYEKYRLFAWND